MKPLQQKFLKAIEDNIDNIGYGDIAINYKGAAKASEQICIKEKIELLKECLNNPTKDFLIVIQNKISELQNQLNNLK